MKDRKFDDGTRIDGEPIGIKRHYSEQTGHSLRGDFQRLAKDVQRFLGLPSWVTVRPQPVQVEQDRRRYMRRITASGRR